MKKIVFAGILLSILAVSCSKSDSNPANPTTTAYMSTAAGNTWTYERVDNSTTPSTTTTYTVTSTTRDTAITGRNYHVYSNSSTGGSEYYYINGNDYYTFQPLPATLGGTSVETLYLKSDAAVNATWSGTINITTPIAMTLNVLYKVTERGLTKTVNNVTYTDVIHVQTVITAPAPFTTALTTNIQSYYAPKYGMIQNDSEIHIDYLGTQLNSVLNTKLKAKNF